MGILQLIHISVVKLLVNHAVFSTARVAVVEDNMVNISYAAKESLPFKDKENIFVEIVSTNRDEDLKVKLTYNMMLIFPIINKVIKNMKHLNGYVMPIEAEYLLPKENILN